MNLQILLRGVLYVSNYNPNINTVFNRYFRTTDNGQTTNRRATALGAGCRNNDFRCRNRSYAIGEYAVAFRYNPGANSAFC